jgi:hypothetical protein
MYLTLCIEIKKPTRGQKFKRERAMRGDGADTHCSHIWSWEKRVTSDYPSRGKRSLAVA